MDSDSFYHAQREIIRKMTDLQFENNHQTSDIEPHHLDPAVVKVKRYATGLMYITGLVFGLFLLPYGWRIYQIVNIETASENTRYKLQKTGYLFRFPILGHATRLLLRDKKETRYRKQAYFVTVEFTMYLFLSRFIWFGSWRARSCKNYRLAKLAAILSLIPWVFTGPPFGTICGFLLLLQLRKPAVKKCFTLSPPGATNFTSE